jgi:THO complex subunit 2
LLETSAEDAFLDYLGMAIEQLLHPESSLTPDLLTSALVQLLPHNSGLPSQVLDVVSQYWLDTSPDQKGPLTAFLQSLLQANLVTTDLAIEIVDKNILQDSALISNAQNLSTRSIRINTGLLYKQQKFNLLREENEGYAKLSHEFNLCLSELPKGGFTDPAEILAKSNELLTIVDALIGYFELDPNRVLDCILDICSQNLLSHSRFMLYFLHHSPWAPVSFATSASFSSIDHIERRRRWERMHIDFVGYYREEMSRSGGSTLTAQLLGLKLRSLSLSSMSDQRVYSSPESLVFLTALLIKSGFVSLAEIYPYVTPFFNTCADLSADPNGRGHPRGLSQMERSNGRSGFHG